MASDIAENEELTSSDNSTDGMYQQAESIFGAVAPILVSRGWSVFPQTRDRRPGHVNYNGIKWIEEHNLPDKLPTKDALELWVRHCSTLNVAAALGPGSGNTFCVDIDVTEPEANAKFVELADEILGYTPLRRVGRAPKIALFYRYDESDPIVNVARKFVEVMADGSIRSADQGIDIQSRGKAITLYGRHHTTGRYFTYLDKNPLLLSPSELPVVTSEQLKVWLEAVDSYKRFYRSPSTAGTSSMATDWVKMGDVSIPTIRLAAGGTGWVEDETGRVVDGRELFLHTLVFRTVTDVENQGISERLIVDRITEAFLARAEVSGRWNENFVRRQALEKVRRMIVKVSRGDLKVASRNSAVNEEGDVVAVGKSSGPNIDHLNGDLAFLPAAPTADKPYSKRGQWSGNLQAGPEGAAEKRAIKEDRSDDLAKVQIQLKDAFEEFFDDVYRDLADPAMPRVHILKAPPGAGKTSAAIRYIASDPRTKAPHLYRDNNDEVVEGRCPIVFLLPTYANIEELRDRSLNLNLDPTLDDADLAAEAMRMGIVSEDDLEARLEDLRRDAIGADLVTMVYRGKIAAGCQMSEKVQMAMQAGIGTAGFCKADVKDNEGNVDTEYCPHYHECPAIAQRRQIDECDVVFMPHPFISLNIPEELKHVRAVIADERVHHLFLHTTTFSANALQIARKRPKLTRREFDAGLRAEDLLADRNLAASVVLDAIRNQRCPVTALRQQRDEGGQPIGNQLLSSALRVCSSAIQKDGSISPTLSLEEVSELCAQPTGTWIREEHRFWKIIEEAFETEIHRELGADRVRDLETRLANLPPNADATERQKLMMRILEIKAMFRLTDDRRDRRIQFLLTSSDTGSQSELIRISWRTTPNWRGTPILLLDASAEAEIVEKIWSGTEADAMPTEVVEHTIKAPRNIRVIAVVDKTYSNSAIVGRAKQMDDERMQCASVLTKLRQAVSTVSGLYGWNRVVAGANIVVRRAINLDWAGPDNVDWCHFGAMRGLDFAKHHAAAISIGRMEIPVHSVDGLAAALTYDDPMPEEPFDRNGNGLDDDGRPLELPKIVQVVPIRNGQDALIPTPSYLGKWARLIQKQYREEELLQFEGRLRPVYRQGEAPVWFSITSCVPEGVIVDDVICLDDLVGKHSMVWEAVRKASGVLDPQIMRAVDPVSFPSPEAALKALSDIGLTGDDWAKSRFAAGMALYEWKSEGTAGWNRIFGMKYLGNPIEQIASVIRYAYGVENVEVRAIEETANPQGRRRTADRIDLELGDVDDRRDGENRALEDAYYTALMRGTKLSSAPQAGKGMSSLKSISAPTRTLPDMQSKQALDRLWDLIMNREDVAQYDASEQKIAKTNEGPGNSEEAIEPQASMLP